MNYIYLKIKCSNKIFGHKKDKVSQQFRILHNEALHDSYISHSFVWCRNLDSSEIRSEVFGKF
jgi:hypothetical protein